MTGDRSDDDAGGYGKPPKWSRFRPGQSGNPRGRPRKAKQDGDVSSVDSAVNEIYRRALQRKVRVKDGDRFREITSYEAIVGAQLQTAARGNAYAQREVMQRARELEADEERRRRAIDDEQREFVEKMIAFRKAMTQRWDEAAREDREPDDPWPHPDDILIDTARIDARIRGPLDASDVPTYEYFRAERDVAFAEAELAFRERRRTGLAGARLYEVIWAIWDGLLPLRWQFAPRLERQRLNFALPSTRSLVRFRDERRADAEVLRLGANLPVPSRASYRRANSMLKPALRLGGYRSLAEFECAAKDHCGVPPWPKGASS